MGNFLNKLSSSDNSILCVVDFQPKVFSLTYEHETIKKQALKMLRLAQLFEIPAILSEQYPKGLGPTDDDILLEFKKLGSNGFMNQKNSFSCCGDTAFNEHLELLCSQVRAKRTTDFPEQPVDIIVFGIESHICIQQTALDLLERNHRVILVDDCITSRSRRNHELAMSRLTRGGAIVSSFESIAFEWSRTKDHPLFKDVSKLIREV